jgi:hypothetical protein
LKERKNQESGTKIITIDEIEEYFLTFNDDSPPKAMSPFLLRLFDTDGDLPENSLKTVAAALEDFLIAELNAVYAPNHALENALVSFRSQTGVGSGSELLAYLNVTFVHEPSPPKDQIEVWLQTIMSDLTYFIHNLTAIDSGEDPELAEITTADQQPYYESVDRGNMTSPIEDGNTGYQPQSQPPPLYSIVPTVVAAALVVLLISFFMMRRRRVKNENDDSREEEERRSLNTKVMQPIRSSDDLLEEDSDIFSFEVSLLESPVVGGSNTEAIESRAVPRSVTKGVAPFKTVDVHENESDLFSGIHSSVTGVTGVSPRNIDESRSIFSFLSGFTGASASTVRHSNVTKEDSRSAMLSSTAASSALDSSRNAGNNVDTPRSRVSSLFAFSEEEEDEEASGESEADSPPVNSEKATDERMALSVASSGDYGPQEADASANRSAMLTGSADALSGKQSYSNLLKQDQASATSPSANVILPLSPVENIESSEPPLVASSGSASDTLEGLGIGSPNSASNPTSPISETGIREGPSEEYSGETSKEQSGEIQSPEKASGRKWAIPGVSALTRLTSKARSGTGSSPQKDGDKKKDPEANLGLNSNEVNLRWDSPSESAKNAAIAAAFVSSVSQTASAADASCAADQSPDGGGRRGRRHAKNTAEDGTEAYQNQAMQPVDWSIHSGENSGSDSGLSPKSHNVDVVEKMPTKKRSFAIKKAESDTPRSQLTNTSTISGLSVSTDMNETTTSHTFDSAQSPSKKLISDLVWLEKKIAGATKNVKSTAPMKQDDREVGLPTIPDNDSISFSSKDANLTNSPSTDSSSLELNSYSGRPPQGLHSIVCRDCFAPPGKLKIVIHSTKDGPAVHTVKEGSSLEGHIFPGDLIISVDNVDTRSYTAEQVMKMMTARTKFERKITVLHFEQGGDAPATS